MSLDLDDPGEPASDMAHPLPVAAVAALLLNDHLLKGSGWLPGWLTGKLSDLAGLFFFPVLLTTAALWALPRRRRGPLRRAVAVLSTLATGVVFAAIKVSPALNAIASSWWGGVVLDPTDLVALPVLGLSLLFLEKRSPAGPAPRWFQGLTVAAAAAASIATPAPRYTRAYPQWEIAEASEQTFSCARTRAFVARSGKEGVGVGVEVLGGGCPVRASARLLVAGRAHPSVESPPVVAAGAPRFLYLPIPFDNEEAWNNGAREATLELQIDAGGERRDLKLAVVHRFDSFYEQRSSYLPPSPSAPAPPARFAAPPPAEPPLLPPESAP